MEFVIVLVVLTLVVLLVTAPLRRAPQAAGDRPPDRGGGEADAGAQRAELEAAREAKYREIRDAELDHRTGKLSEADFRAVDAALRAEAVDILRRLDQLSGAGGAGGERP